MPNISSIELLLILVVALLVIGPERLPAAIRTASLWLGRFRRSFYKVKAEIEREINADEVRRQLHNESVLADIRDAKSDVQKAASDARTAASDAKESVNKIVNSKDFDPGASPATDEQLRNAEAERKAAVTGAGADSKETDSESRSGDEPQATTAAEETDQASDQSSDPAPKSAEAAPATEPGR